MSIRSIIRTVDPLVQATAGMVVMNLGAMLEQPFGFSAMLSGFAIISTGAWRHFKMLLKNQDKDVDVGISVLLTCAGALILSKSVSAQFGHNDSGWVVNVIMAVILIVCAAGEYHDERKKA